jgi:hypothetical protein
MNVKEAWEIHRNTYREASQVNRQLGLAGLAVIWIFKSIDLTIPRQLYIPAILIVVGLGCDLIQYFLHSIIWHFALRKTIKQNMNPDDEFEHLQIMNYPAYVLWFLKILSVLVAYACLIKFLFERVL